MSVLWPPSWRDLLLSSVVRTRAVDRIFFYRAKETSAGRAEVRGSRGWERVWSFWGGGSQPASHKLGSLGQQCKLPQLGPGWSPVRQTVFTRFKCSERPLQAVWCCLLFFVKEELFLMLIIHDKGYEKQPMRPPWLSLWTLRHCLNQRMYTRNPVKSMLSSPKNNHLQSRPLFRAENKHFNAACLPPQVRGLLRCTVCSLGR